MGFSTPTTLNSLVTTFYLTSTTSSMSAATFITPNSLVTILYLTSRPSSMDYATPTTYISLVTTVYLTSRPSSNERCNVHHFELPCYNPLLDIAALLHALCNSHHV